MREELLWLKNKHGIDGLGKIKLYGSIFVPTPSWLHRFRFRPWNGVYVDSKFLNSVESAWKGAQVILALYKDMNVQPLIESPTRKDVDLDNGGRFLREVANSESLNYYQNQ